MIKINGDEKCRYNLKLLIKHKGIMREPSLEKIDLAGINFNSYRVKYHHTNYDVPCVLMGDVRTEHITCLTKEVWQKKYRYKDLKTIPGVGKDMEQHFFDVGIHTIDDLKEANPEELYEKACIIKGCSIDKCVLYVFRLAVYYANNEVHEPEKLKWWYWKDKNTDEYTNLHK